MPMLTMQFLVKKIDELIEVFCESPVAETRFSVSFQWDIFVYFFNWIKFHEFFDLLKHEWVLKIFCLFFLMTSSFMVRLIPFAGCTWFGWDFSLCIWDIQSSVCSLHAGHWSWSKVLWTRMYIFRKGWSYNLPILNFQHHLKVHL